MFCSFYLILYIIWFQLSLSLSPFYYFDYYEHQYFTSVLFHVFSFIKNALFGSYSWMSHRTFIESSAVTTAFWLDQYGGRFASIFRRCQPSMFWGQCARPLTTDLNTWIAGSHGFAYSSMRATGNPSAAILLQSKHWIDTLTYAHVSAWNATGDRFLASNFMKILGKKWQNSPDLQDS